MYCEYQLIPNQLVLTIYEEGFGLTPSLGSFINLLHQISIENSPVNIAKTTHFFIRKREDDSWLRIRAIYGPRKR
jgi:hypothetical protein